MYKAVDGLFICHANSAFTSNKNPVCLSLLYFFTASTYLPRRVHRLCFTRKCRNEKQVDGFVSLPTFILYESDW
jgi:hypothetical protein